MIRLLNSFIGKIRYKFDPIIGRCYEMVTNASRGRCYDVLFELSNGLLDGERALLFYAYEPRIASLFLPDDGYHHRAIDYIKDSIDRYHILARRNG